MQEIKEKFFEGEHALYGLSNAILENVTFGNGESPLKETKDLVIKNNIFKYKYPLWYSDNIKVTRPYNLMCKDEQFLKVNQNWV